MPRSPHEIPAGWAGSLAAWLQRRRGRHQLLALSDRTLDDLGLSRADVEGAGAVPFRQAIDVAELDARRRRHRPRLAGLAAR